MRKKVRAWCTKRKDGWWYAYFYDEEGKYRGQSLETKSKKDAERKFKDFEKELAAKIVAKESADDCQDHLQWLEENHPDLWSMLENRKEQPDAFEDWSDAEQLAWYRGGGSLPKPGFHDPDPTVDYLGRKQKTKPIVSEKLNLPVDEFWTQYAEAESQRVSKLTIVNNRVVWNGFVALMRPKTLSDVSSESVRRYIETRRETEVNGKKLSGKTLRCNLISLQSIFKWAIEEGYYAGLNPAAEARKKVRIKREPRPKVQSLTTGQLTKCLELAKEVDTDTYLAFAIGALGGLRISEVGNLRWEDSIDFDSDTITIEPREEGEDISDFDTKTPGSQRAVPLFAELKEILLPHRQDSGYVVFPNKKFRYPFSLQPQVAAVRKRLKLDWFTFHKLRHTFVSLHLNTHKDLTLEQVSKVLGHRSVAMTADTYMDLLTTEMDKSARLLNGHGIKSGRENIRMRR